MQNGLNLKFAHIRLKSMQLEGQSILSKGVLHYEQEVKEYVKTHHNSIIS